MLLKESCHILQGKNTCDQPIRFFYQLKLMSLKWLHYSLIEVFKIITIVLGAFVTHYVFNKSLPRVVVVVTGFCICRI